MCRANPNETWGLLHYAAGPTRRISPARPPRACWLRSCTPASRTSSVEELRFLNGIGGETVASLQTILSLSEPRLDEISERKSSWRYGHGLSAPNEWVAPVIRERVELEEVALVLHYFSTEECLFGESENPARKPDTRSTADAVTTNHITSNGALGEAKRESCPPRERVPNRPRITRKVL
jgi:hypothetical protein